MSKTKILSMISALMSLLLASSLVTSAAASNLDTSTWRADVINRHGFATDDGGYSYQYWYEGSMKGEDNAVEYGNYEAYYSVVTLWDIWDPSDTPVYFEDFYTYTITFNVNLVSGEAFFDDTGTFGVGESSLSAASSTYKCEIYGQPAGTESDPTLSITANPLTYYKGGYSLPLDEFFDNVAVGTSKIDNETGEIKIVFSSPSRTLEHEWDMLIVDMSMFSTDWVEDAGPDDIYMSDLSVVYDKDLSAYEAAVAEGLTEIGGKIDDLENTIEQGQQQAHADAEAIKDAINNQGEKEKNEANAGGNANVAALQGAFGDFSVDSYNSVIKTLYDAMMYDGTDATWTLPSSGKVPFLNATLWEEQEIDMTPDYIVNHESFNLVYVATNLCVAVSCVYVTVYFFNSLLTTLNAGHSTKGGDDGE